jgi:PAS domain S-box-containing protein
MKNRDDGYEGLGVQPVRHSGSLIRPDILALAPVGIVTLDRVGTILCANPKAASMLEADGDLAGQPFARFVHEQSLADYTILHNHLFEKNGTAPLDLLIVKESGETFWASLTASIVQAAGDEDSGLMVITDISFRKSAEMSLRDDVTRYRVLMDLAVDGILLGNHGGVITEANERMCALVGMPREAIVGRHISELRFTPESMKKYPFRFDLLHKGETVVSERVLVRPDGAEIPVEVRTKMMPDGSYQSIYLDITERKRSEEALKESEHFLKESQRAAHIGSYATDLNTRVWKASAELYRIFGIDETHPHNLDGWASMIHPDFREKLFAYHLEVEAEKKRFDYEYKIIRPGSGEERWVHGLGELEFDDGMIPVRMTGTIQDITDRKKAQEALRESEETYRTIFENTGTSVILIEEDMTISMANGQFIRHTGFAPEEVIGRMKWTEFAHPDDVKRMAEQHRIRREKKDAGLSAYEVRFFTKAGELRYALLNVKLVAGTKKSVASLIDITRRREAEKKLMASEEKFRTLAEYSPLGILLHQGDLWVYGNHAATEICGYTDAELRTMRFWDFIHPDFRDTVRETGRKRQQGEGVPPAYEFKIITKSGEEKWVSITGSRIQFEDKPTALIAVMDVTERKRNEEEKAKLQGQLQQAQKMESIGRLAGGVAHDFNNMLGVILGHTDLALIGLDPFQPLYAHLTEIRKASERSADLTRQLLAFARKQTIAPKILDLNETVTGMLKMLRRLIGEDIHLVWKPAIHVWPVKMDPSQIDQILVNLCVNARDAINGVGKMTIETENTVLDPGYAATHVGFLSGEYVKVSVSDNGCGMDRETLSHIFEPFYTTKEVNKGTGLGLATVYGAVKQNKGFINAYSEPGKGTTITIYLPRYAGKEEQIRKKAPAETIVRGHETILLVEDEPAILEVTTMLLELQGYKVLTAGTPGEAIALAGAHGGEIHLLLTDVVMPEMNGRELAKNLLSLYPDLKRLFMSGYTANVIAHHGVLDEGVHFIQKPFSANDLAARVREALDMD